MTDAGSAGGERRRSLRAVYGAFVVSGTATYVVGALLPHFSQRWGLSYATLAWLAPAQFTASSIGALVSNLNLRRSVALGYLCVALGLAGTSLGWPAALLAMALVGFGLGLSIPASNVLVGRLNPDRRGAALSLLNLMWGVGAIGCQLLFYVLAGRLELDAAPWILAAGSALASAAAFRWVGREPANGGGPARAESSAAVSVGPLVLLTLQLLLYTGTEASVASWLVALCTEHDASLAPVAYLVGAGFWGALLVGRALAPAWLVRRSEVSLHVWCLAASGTGIAGLLVSRSLVGTAAAAVLVGAGFAPLYALIASMIVARTEGVRASLTGAVFAIGSAGPAVLPWITGQIAGGAGSIRVAFLVPAIGVTAMALLLWLYHARSASDALPRAPLVEPDPLR